MRLTRYLLIGRTQSLQPPVPLGLTHDEDSVVFLYYTFTCSWTYLGLRDDRYSRVNDCESPDAYGDWSSADLFRLQLQLLVCSSRVAAANIHS